MNLLIYIIFFSIVSGSLSLLGGVLLISNTKLLRKFSIHLVSFAAGALLATSFIHLLPESIHGLDHDLIPFVFMSALFGVVLFFIFEQIYCRIHAHPVEAEEGKHATPVLINIGDAIHNLVDGVAIAGAFLVDIRLGIITALAVAAHEVPQEISDFAILYFHGWKRKKIIITNLLISLTNIVGALITYLVRDSIHPFLPYIIAFTAGNFIYIGAASLFPQLSSKKHDKPSHVIILLLLGILAIYFFGQIIDIH